jgi:hypothetical protein
MAKVGTLNHPKTLHLAELLNIEPWAALGLLEALWGWVSEYAPQGNLGKHSDAVIADGIKWRKKSDVLIKVLIKSGWVDESDEHRLLIHDWAEHIPDYILKRLQRKGLRPISTNPSGHRADAARTPNGSHAADPVRAETQPNPTQPNPTSTTRIPSIDDLTVFMVKAKRRNPEADALACGKFYDIQNWCDSEGRPIRVWQKYAGYWIEKNPEAPAPRQLTEEDLELIHR